MAEDITIRLEDLFSRRRINTAIRMIAKSKTTVINDIEPAKLHKYWRENGNVILNSIYDETYQPKPQYCKIIPKDSGGTRMLMIPGTLDKMLQRVTAEGLYNFYDGQFSQYSYGFRKGKSVKDAVQECTNIINRGYQYVIYIDIRSFFDTVNHDVLRYILMQRISDSRIIHWIMKNIKAPISNRQIGETRKTGISQGSPLSPCLANIYLNVLDEFLEYEGIPFIRYADDITLFSEDKFSGRRYVKMVRDFLRRILKLEINGEKTKIVPAEDASFLGFHFMKKGDNYALRIADNNIKEHIDKLKKKLQEAEWENGEILQELGDINRGWTEFYNWTDKDFLENILGKIDCMEYKYMRKGITDSSIWENSHFTFNMQWYRRSSGPRLVGYILRR